MLSETAADAAQSVAFVDKGAVYAGSGEICGAGHFMPRTVRCSKTIAAADGFLA